MATGKYTFRNACRALFYGDTGHVLAHPSCPTLEPLMIRTLITSRFPNLLPWTSLIAVPRGTVNKEPFWISLLSLSGCCDSSRATPASRPSTITDPLPSNRPGPELDRGAADGDVDDSSIVFPPVVDTGSIETVGVAIVVALGFGTTSVPSSSAGKPGEDFAASARGEGRAHL